MHLESAAHSSRPTAESTTIIVVTLIVSLFFLWGVANNLNDILIKQFKKAFDASDVEGVVKLFAPDAVFLGTVSPVLATKTDQIDKYFQGLRQLMPRSITIDEYSTIVVSENAVLFAGMDTFSQTKDGNVIKTPARFTMLITKTDGGWRISHFHSSVRPSS